MMMEDISSRMAVNILWEDDIKLRPEVFSSWERQCDMEEKNWPRVETQSEVDFTAQTISEVCALLSILTNLTSFLDHALSFA